MNTPSCSQLLMWCIAGGAAQSPPCSASIDWPLMNWFRLVILRLISHREELNSCGEVMLPFVNVSKNVLDEGGVLVKDIA